MTETVWLPSLLVLGIGLAAGLAAAVAVRRRRGQRDSKPGQELQVRDLEARREELYRRLRSPELNAGDRESLELAAAHTLRELDRLDPHRSKREQREALPEQPGAAAGVPLPIGGRHSALVGFVAGMAVVLLIGSLVYLAFRDSGAERAPVTAGAGSEAPHPDRASLPAEMKLELERLEAAVAASPNDLLAFKRLALGRLEAGLYFEAFGDAETILASRPEDPDGLFIQGVVRLSMGQMTEALDLLDRVLARYPEHLQAMVYRGLALAQGGDLEQAIATWELALEMAGGRHPELESLLQQAYAQEQSPAAPPASAAPPPPPIAPSGPAYRITVELAPGHTPAPTATLFVFLRPGESGPPVAVKRLPAPRFPLQLTLAAGDSMMEGAEIPTEGILVARLDVDGSVSSRSPEDLETSSPATIGEPVRLVLGSS